ncbi:hypothetical protein [Kitasatospora sp. NPDC059673]|uniref:hypothetical protein n=1 Tax=Kitasatospora sp. NPDC059673 TaxID=3346901 RepID=UPI003674BC93
MPTAPQFANADAVVDALDKAGVPCRVTLRNTLNGGSKIDCTATVNSNSFEYVVEVYDPGRFTRDDIGDAIAAGRTAFHQTFVAAGNWRINVVNPAYAPQIAQALGGVVLPGDELTVPDYPLPSIPTSPRYDSIDQLAAALDAAVGCEERAPGAAGSLTCRTGSKVGHTPNCATLQLYGSDTDRDKALRTAVAFRGAPAALATAANWSISLCDYGLADQVAKELNGVVVRYNGQ